jgi:pSer/pThr/pTyr-binding forkhead associated (FHA) protein
VELIVRRAGHPDRVQHLQEGIHTIGRAEQSDVVLEDVSVSRTHARIIVSPQSVVIEDPGSNNGTFLRGEQVSKQAVQQDDEIIIEPFVLRFNLNIRGESKERFVARLEVIQGVLEGEVYGVGDEGITLGRAEDQTIQIRDAGASRWHASVIWRAGQCVVQDNQSANGVHVNGERVAEKVLVHGDVVRVAKTVMRFVTESLGGGPVVSAPAAGLKAPVAPGTKTNWMPWIVATIVILTLLFMVFAMLMMLLYMGYSRGMFSLLMTLPAGVA